MLGFVKASNLLLHIDPNTYNCFNNHENNEGCNSRVGYGYSYSYQLRHELARIPVKDPLACIINRRIGKNTCKKRSNCTADCMNSKSVECIIVAEFGFEECNGTVWNNSCCYTDDN